MRTPALLTVVFLALLVAPASAQKAKKAAKRIDPEAAAIRATALDYIEGWYEGDVERMTRAVHPELAKRIVYTQGEHSMLDTMGASKLIAGVRKGIGKETPKEKQRKDVTILDRYENAASVKVMASDWVDYLHLAKVDGRWVIVNVLWEICPQKK